MVKYTQTICRLLPTNCLSVFDHFMWFALKGLNLSEMFLIKSIFSVIAQVYWKPDLLVCSKQSSPIKYFTGILIQIAQEQKYFIVLCLTLLKETFTQQVKYKSDHRCWCHYASHKQSHENKSLTFNT